ncbi:hypothetical protein FACS189456_4730 [Bacteroidia bacterium]|nr:hypothetical protein FACS189456_4730 [Bacteroidia bacterium]
MKNTKFIRLVMALSIAVLATSCEEPEAGGTSVEPMCGEWITYSPDFDFSYTVRTTNTSDNASDKLLVTDRNAAGTGASFWGYTVRTNCDLSTKTFSCTNVDNEYWSETAAGVYNPYEIKVSIRNGKITERAVELPSGIKADKIEFEIWFEDISGEGFPSDYFTSMIGYRRSGFLEDESFVYTGEE